ncbi:MAG: RNA polymerase sigma factor [Ilumatobacteraceae bacterium]
MNTIPWERVERAQRGDRAAIEAIVREVHPLVHNVCRRTLNNDADADDATQNALINVVRNIGRFDGRSSFTTWVYRTATNAASDERRRRHRRRLRLGSVVSDEHEMADDAGPVVETRVDDADQLRSLLQQLPEEFRVAVVLRDIMDLDYEEIAEVLGVPGGTVRSRIARGRAKLAELLGNQTSGDERQNLDRKHHGQ